MKATDPHAFDILAADYEQGIDDPWRHRFANGADFFIEQKCRVMERELARRGAPVEPPRVLDVGCGKGPALQFLAGHWRMFGAEVSRQMLRGAPAGLRVVVQEPFALPFVDNTFAVVFAFCVYHHIDEADHARHLAELVRIVKPNGTIFVFEHNPLNPITQIIFQRAPVDRGCRMVPARRLQRLFREAGLTTITTGYLLFLPERLARVARWIEDAIQWLPLGGQYFVAGTKRA